MASLRSTSRRAVLGTVLAVSAAALSGCAAARANGPRSPYDDGGVHAPTTAPRPRPVPEPTDPALDEDVQGAVTVVDGFWTEEWGQYFTGSYSPPEVAGYYDASSGLTCGDQPTPPDNALYCPADDYVAWDSSFMANGYASGDSFVYLVIAHEWGHAIQNRLDPSLVPEARELQADCLAGAELAGAIQDGQLTLEDGDSEEIVAAFVAMGDAEPWSDEYSHGTAEQRLSAFETGVSGDVPACLATGGSREQQ